MSEACSTKLHIDDIFAENMTFQSYTNNPTTSAVINDQSC